jgi:hypothetical protein
MQRTAHFSWAGSKTSLAVSITESKHQCLFDKNGLFLLGPVTKAGLLCATFVHCSSQK